MILLKSSQVQLFATLIRKLARFDLFSIYHSDSEWTAESVGFLPCYSGNTNRSNALKLKLKLIISYLTLLFQSSWKGQLLQKSSTGCCIIARASSFE